MVIGTPPRESTLLEPEVRDALRRYQSAIRDVSGEVRRLGPKNQFAYGRVNAVGADDNVRIGGKAVMEFQFDLIRMLDETNASMIQMERAVRQRSGEDIE